MVFIWLRSYILFFIGVAFGKRTGIDGQVHQPAAPSLTTPLPSDPSHFSSRLLEHPET